MKYLTVIPQLFAYNNLVELYLYIHEVKKKMNFDVC